MDENGERKYQKEKGNKNKIRRRNRKNIKEEGKKTKINASRKYEEKTKRKGKEKGQRCEGRIKYWKENEKSDSRKKDRK